MYESNIVAENIKKTAKTNNVQLKDMLLDLHLNKNTLSNMYKGSMLKGDSLARIADYLECSVDYILGRSLSPEIYFPVDVENSLNTTEIVSNPKDNINEEHIQPEINTEPYIKEIPKNVIKIPLENLSVSAGSGQELIDDFNDIENEYIEIDADDFPKVDRAFRVKGDSMEPKYHDNDIVLVKCQPVIENGDIGIFTLNEKGYIKKFNIDSDNNRTLVSLNKNYAPIPLNTNDDVRVVGRVLCTL